MEIVKIEKKNLVSEVHRQIREMILSGSWSEGDVYKRQTVFHAVPVLLGVLAFQVHSQPQAAAAAQAHQQVQRVQAGTPAEMCIRDSY